MSGLLDLESTVGSPPNGNLALNDLPVLHESRGPQDESGGVVKGIGCAEQPESTAECGDYSEGFGVSCKEVEV